MRLTLYNLLSSVCLYYLFNNPNGIGRVCIVHLVYTYKDTFLPVNLRIFRRK